jgi:hypothetical protein
LFHLPGKTRLYCLHLRRQRVIGDLDIDRYHNVREKLGTLSNAERIVL